MQNIQFNLILLDLSDAPTSAGSPNYSGCFSLPRKANDSLAQNKQRVIKPKPAKKICPQSARTTCAEKYALDIRIRADFVDLVTLEKSGTRQAVKVSTQIIQNKITGKMANRSIAEFPLICVQYIINDAKNITAIEMYFCIYLFPKHAPHYEGLINTNGGMCADTAHRRARRTMLESAMSLTRLSMEERMSKYEIVVLITSAITAISTTFIAYLTFQQLKSNKEKDSSQSKSKRPRFKSYKVSRLDENRIILILNYHTPVNVTIDNFKICSPKKLFRKPKAIKNVYFRVNHQDKRALPNEPETVDNHFYMHVITPLEIFDHGDPLSLQLETRLGRLTTKLSREEIQSSLKKYDEYERERTNSLRQAQRTRS